VANIIVQMDKSIVGYGNRRDVISLTETAEVDLLIAEGAMHIYTGTIAATPVHVSPVYSVNGVGPDGSGNVTVTGGTGGGPGSDTTALHTANALSEFTTAQQAAARTNLALGSAATSAATAFDAAGLAGAAQAFAVQRANHTGTQSADTIVPGTTNTPYTVTEQSKLASLGNVALTPVRLVVALATETPSTSEGLAGDLGLTKGGKIWGPKTTDTTWPGAPSFVATGSALPIGVDATAGNGSASVATAGTFTWTHNVGAGANQIIVLISTARPTAGTRTVASVTFAGSTMTLLGNVVSSATTTNREVYAWTLANPATGVGTVTVTTNAVGAAGMQGESISLLNTLNTFGTVQTAISGSATTVNATVTSSAAEFVVGVFSARTTAAPTDGSAGTTRLANGVVATNTGYSMNTAVGAASVTFTYAITTAADNMAMLMVPVR
jgi:hypothetical protein